MVFHGYGSIIYGILKIMMRDLGIVVLSIVIAIILAKTEVLIGILTVAMPFEILGSFIAGVFFTSIFTVAPAAVALGQIAQHNSVWVVAFFGGLGAVVGDLIIFRFVRDRFSEHLMQVLQEKGISKRIKAVFKIKLFRWMTFLLGGLIIASPLPDELGISLLGFSKMKTSWFIPLSFMANFGGILVIGFVAKL